MDLSYWAFVKLAHPLYGDMTIQARLCVAAAAESGRTAAAPLRRRLLLTTRCCFSADAADALNGDTCLPRQFRPVDCKTRQPIGEPGATNVIYDGDTMSGWGVNSDKMDWFNLTLPAGGTAAGLGGSSNRNATCAQISGAGGLLGFFCARCRNVFTDAVRLSIRGAQQITGNPSGNVPPLQVVVSSKQYNSTGGGGEVFCDNKPVLSDAYKTGTANGYTQCAHACVGASSKVARFTRALAHRCDCAGTPFRSPSSSARAWTAPAPTASRWSTPRRARATCRPSASTSCLCEAHATGGRAVT